MTLLEFAAGPALYVSLAVFVLGAGWRLIHLIRIKKRVDLSVGRGNNETLGGLWMIASRSINHGPLTDRIKMPIANAYLMHLVLFIVIFLAAEHIEIVRNNFGFGWPALPELVVRISTYVLLASILITAYRRLRHPVLQLLSNFDDWFSLIVTALPVVTGLIAALPAERNDTLIAIHVLAFNLLLIWFPFGKLMHAFLIAGSRYATGVVFAHKGARL